MNGDRSVRVLLCDDHAMIREGLMSLLSPYERIDIVGAAGSGEECIGLALELRPDVVLMDLAMPGVGGVEAIKRITAALPAARSVVLTSFGDAGRVRDAIAAGAVGYMLKDADGDELVRAILSAARGEAPLDPRVAVAVLGRDPRTRALTDLTAREREVLALVSQGLANKVIATRLGISEATVKAHLTRIFRQIGAADRTQAAIWARENLQLSPADGQR